MKRYVCVHGHFYQPPRVNPWLEVVEVQDSAHPFHDWNARVAAECYAPNAAARIMDDRGKISRIVNNYQRISFNFGPTLLSWLEEFEPATYARLLAADRESLKRFGHGNALAQVYNHIIMPLANRRDKLTQIRWAITDFQRRFQRRPEGMWLSETACDSETLAALAGEGILFTILAPRQAARVRPLGDGNWRDASGGRVDPRRPYMVQTKEGPLAVFFYDGPASQGVAFEGLLADGHKLAGRLAGLLDPDPLEAQLAHVATDGESYGHHHRYGEMALAYALDLWEKDSTLELTNYGAFLEAHPPTWEAEVVENSSWSCVHGIERWRADCGCALDPGRGWSQAWRKPLREGLDRLNDHLAALFEKQGAQVFSDPWQARDAYVEALPCCSPDSWRDFLAAQARPGLTPEQEVLAGRLLESQRWAMFMFTSCGWFFDDLAGIEPVQNLRFAARALHLVQDLNGAADWLAELRETLATARSNQPAQGNGATIWDRQVAPVKVGRRRVAAHAAISGVMSEAPPPEELYCFRLTTLFHRHRENLGLDVSWGRVQVAHARLGQERDLVYAALHAGGHEFTALVGEALPGQDLAGVEREVEEPLRLLDQGAILAVLRRLVGGKIYTLGDLFLEGRRTLAQRVLARVLDEHRETARVLYEASRDTMAFLHSINVPLPPVFTAVAEAIIGEDLVRGIRAGDLPPRRLGELASSAKQLGLRRLGVPAVGRALSEALVEDLNSLMAEPGDTAPTGHALALLDLAAALEMEPDLWRAQNLFDQLCTKIRPAGLSQPLRDLGDRLNFDPEAESPAEGEPS